jgi:hypothetical protein
MQEWNIYSARCIYIKGMASGGGGTVTGITWKKRVKRINFL